MISTSICRYQSLNLNHIREHSMPIYEFRWQRRTLVLSQERDGPYCHVVRWDGNNKESIGAKMGAELPVVAVGQWMLRLSSGWTCREGERQELKGNRSVTGGHLPVTAELMFASYSFLIFCWSVFIWVLCNSISFVLSVELWKSSCLVSEDTEHEVNMKFSMWE